jgi:hypothetical protein
MHVHPVAPGAPHGRRRQPPRDCPAVPRRSRRIRFKPEFRRELAGDLGYNPLLTKRRYPS